MSKPVLEPAAQAFADATANPPYLFELSPEQGRKAVDAAQSPQLDVPGTPPSAGRRTHAPGRRTKTVSPPR